MINDQWSLVEKAGVSVSRGWGVIVSMAVFVLAAARSLSVLSRWLRKYD